MIILDSYFDSVQNYKAIILQSCGFLISNRTLVTSCQVAKSPCKQIARSPKRQVVGDFKELLSIHGVLYILGVLITINFGNM